MTTLVLTHPTGDPDPVTNPQPKPKPAVWPYVSLGVPLFLLAATALAWLTGAGA